MGGHELRRVRRMGRKRWFIASPADVVAAPAGLASLTVGGRERRCMRGFVALAVSIVFAAVPVLGAGAASMKDLGTLGGKNSNATAAMRPRSTRWARSRGALTRRAAPLTRSCGPPAA
jgi:hypothetical protein